MPKGYSPAIFVSSTCYDLSQIRADLKIFIESIGLDPILSDQNSFPINPNYDTILNCLENVKNKSDIFILVIGGRYGFQTDTGKSVTNLEYLEAKSKNIPVYIFVNKSIINILPIWQKNKGSDYSDVVDTPKLFEFIELLRNESGNWVFPFENAQDIISILKTQLAYLFMDSLVYRSHMHGNKIDKEFTELSPRALELFFTKPDGWEYTLFSQVLKDKIDSYRKERFDVKYGISYEKSSKIDSLDELGGWLSSHISEVINTVASITKLLNIGLPVAFGDPGVSGDDKHIYYIATRIAEGYKKLLDWTLDVRNVDVDESFEKVIKLCSQMTDNAIPEIEEFVEKVYIDINETISQIGSQTEKKFLELTLTLTVPDQEELNKEISKLSVG